MRIFDWFKKEEKDNDLCAISFDSADDASRTHASLFNKLSSIQINAHEDIEKFIPITLSTLSQKETQLLAYTLRAAIEFDNYKDWKEALVAILEGKVKLGFGKNEKELFDEEKTEEEFGYARIKERFESEVKLSREKGDIEQIMKEVIQRCDMMFSSKGLGCHMTYAKCVGKLCGDDIFRLVLVDSENKIVDSYLTIVAPEDKHGLKSLVGIIESLLKSGDVEYYDLIPGKEDKWIRYIKICQMPDGIIKALKYRKVNSRLEIIGEALAPKEFDSLIKIYNLKRFS